MNKSEAYTLNINSDMRYYIGEPCMTDGASLLETVYRYNDIKMDMYNVLYDRKYKDRGPLKEGITYSAYLKNKYKIRDYYCAAIYSEASAALSSQDKLFKASVKAKEADIKAREDKIADTHGILKKKQAVKESVVHYIRYGEWKSPYPSSRLTVKDGMIGSFFTEPIRIEDYEYRVEADIRELKNRIAMLEEGLRRAENKLEKMKSEGPARIVFGGRNLYRKKDMPGTDKDAWKQEYFEARHRSMTLPGRYTSKYGNYLARYDKDSHILSVTCMNGKTALLKDFNMSRYSSVFLSLLDPKNRQSICYSFQIRCDGKGRLYLIPSVILHPENECPNFGFSDGCVAMDMNYDHFALSDIGPDGSLIENKIVWFDIEGKSSGQITDIIGRAMSVVGKYCEDRHKCLVMEDLNTSASKNGMRYGNRSANRKKSAFAYDKMRSSAMAQGYKRNFTVYTVNPAYTSFAGKILYMRKFGISIHEAASYVIGLVGMGRLDLCRPPEELLAMIPEKKEQADSGTAANASAESKSRTEIPGNTLSAAKKRKPRSEWHTVHRNPVTERLTDSILEAWGREWKILCSAAKGIRTHAFYSNVYEEDWTKRKRHTLKNYFTILKQKDRYFLEQQLLSSHQTAGIAEVL